VKFHQYLHQIWNICCELADIICPFVRENQKQYENHHQISTLHRTIFHLEISIPHKKGEIPHKNDILSYITMNNKFIIMQLYELVNSP
jgi:hypothetical protein